MNGLLEAYCEQLIRDQSMDQAAVGSYARLLCRSRRRPLLVRFWLQLAAGFGLQECQAIWDCAVDDFGAWRCGDVEHAPGEEGWCLEVEEISMQVGPPRQWGHEHPPGEEGGCLHVERTAVQVGLMTGLGTSVWTAVLHEQVACPSRVRPPACGLSGLHRLATAAAPTRPLQSLRRMPAPSKTSCSIRLILGGHQAAALHQGRCEWLPRGEHGMAGRPWSDLPRKARSAEDLTKLALSLCRWLMNLPHASRAAPWRECRPPGGCPSRSSPTPWSAQ